MVSQSVSVRGKKYNLRDMQKWFVQIRGFPSILSFGSGRNRIMGEGQTGGRYVTDIAHEAESKFVKRLGTSRYQLGIDKLMKRRR